MEEHKTKMDVERECEEVRRIFADAGTRGYYKRLGWLDLVPNYCWFIFKRMVN